MRRTRRNQATFWITFWARRTLPPRPSYCSVEAYEEFRRHVREEITVVALAQEAGESRQVVESRLGQTHRLLYNPHVADPQR